MYPKLPPFPQQYQIFLTVYGTRFLIAGLITIGGYWLIKLVLRAIGRLLTQQQIDRDVQPFLLSLMRIGLLVALVLSVLSTLGVETNSFLAVIGTAGLAVGLALQGSLANFAGGLLILALKPFREGDLIAVTGLTGYVQVVNLLNTVLITDDNRTITLPNNTLTTNAIVNYSRLETIRVDSSVTVGNGHSIAEVRVSIQKAIANCSVALPDRQHDVLVSKLTDSGIQFDVRVWALSRDLPQVNHAVLEAIGGQFVQDGIKMPRNEIDVLRFL
ncbi:MAG: mechanosensitive ion channel family protein [Cytophagales bacterium]|nr:MAG: mechanosensitive ion channel family protein [Cytophagales bacterium]